MSLGQLLYNLHDKILLDRNVVIDHNNIFVLPSSGKQPDVPHTLIQEGRG